MGDGIMQFAQLLKLLPTVEDRPSWDAYFLALARLIATRSPCSRLHVGCVLVTRGNHVIAVGYNGFLAGHPHHSHVRDNHELATVHAEQNAVADAARRGVSTNGSRAYLTHYPCIHCAKSLLAAGVGHLTYYCDYANDSLVGELFRWAEVPLVQWKEGEGDGCSPAGP
jgi:dCMP deaminase